MLLEARAANCFSSTFVLKADGRPVGKFEGQWLSESLDIHLTGRRQLQFEKLGWLGSRFVLRDASGRPLGTADRSSVFTSAWDLGLSTGPGRLEKEDWLGSAYIVRQDGEGKARVDRTGWCERGWQVEGGLHEEDLLLIGLVYHTIGRRAAQAQAAAHPAGS
jgi:hypothetical protein